MEAKETKPEIVLNKHFLADENINSMSNNRYQKHQISHQKIDPEAPTIRFARSMNFPKDSPIFSLKFNNKNNQNLKINLNVNNNLSQSSLQKTSQVSESQQFEIPQNEYIWEAPYLKKTQIFPSYVSTKIKIIQYFVHFKILKNNILLFT